MIKKTVVGSLILIGCIATPQKKADDVDARAIDASPIVETVFVEDASIPEHKSCPDDMVEVDGDFCQDVEQNCINLDKSIHNVNGYVRCWEFSNTKCLSKTRTHMHFCIDKYEWPNIAGQKPIVMVSWNNMKKNCSNLGKRLCIDHEWSLACEGPDILPYPYGYKRDDTACNIDHNQRAGFDASKSPMTPKIVEWLNQSVPSGSMPRCVSPYGVYDLTGNVDESVVNTGGYPYKSAEMGGHWVKGARNRCRPKTTVHGEDVVFYEFGGRCCSDVK